MVCRMGSSGQNGVHGTGTVHKTVQVDYVTFNDGRRGVAIRLLRVLVHLQFRATLPTRRVTQPAFTLSFTNDLPLPSPLFCKPVRIVTHLTY